MTFTNPFNVTQDGSEFDPIAPVTAADMQTGGVQRKAGASKGGEYTVGKKVYWFPGDLYEEVLKRDDETPLTKKGDREFAKWIKAFIKEHEEVTVVDTIRKSRSYGGGYGMSGYWAMPYHYKTFGDESTTRLATILRAMRTVLSVTDPQHRLAIKYTDARTSGWMDGQVVLPIEPAKNITDLEEAINVMGGFAIHEAWHSIYTRPFVDNICKAWMAEDGWNKQLLNIADDVRIEFNGLKVTPGTRQYLNYTSEYLWDDANPLPPEWNEDDTREGLNARVQSYFMFVREADRAEELLTHPSFEAPKAWLLEWQARYVEQVNANPVFEVVEKHINELREYLRVPEEPDPQMQPMKSLVILTPCGYNDGDKGLDEEGQEAVAEAIEAESEAVEANKWMSTFGMGKRPTSEAHLIWNPYDGSALDSAIIRKPRVTRPDLYKASNGGLVEKAKAALSLRKAVAQADTRLMKSGLIDEDELYRFVQGDMKFFKDATVETVPDAAVYLLVDMSGSMGSAEHEKNSAYYAVRLAQLFVEGLSVHPNVTVKVLGHTGDNMDNDPGASFYRIWEQGDPITRLSTLYETVRQGNNYDGWALAWAGQLIKQEHVDQRLIIVLSDGQPHGHQYGGVEAYRHVREVSDRLIRQGVDVVQVAVGAGVARSAQEAMYKHFIELRDAGGGDPFATVFRKLTKVLQKFV